MSEAGHPWRDEDDRDTAADLAAWHRQGFSDEQAGLFRRWRFTLAQAVAWRQAGVPDGVQAAQWVTAGVTPDSVDRWRAAGIDAGQAVHWHEIGYDLAAATDAIRRGLTPQTAFGQRPSPHFQRGPVASAMRSSRLPPGVRGDIIRRFLDAGVPPQIMHDYLAGDWTAEDALPWAKAGVESRDAIVWRALGLSAAEAGRLSRKGEHAVDTVRDWWQAGIPFGEVADWIGAGLTAQEAASQRARGITAEQAATLRALRDQDDDS